MPDAKDKVTLDTIEPIGVINANIMDAYPLAGSVNTEHRVVTDNYNDIQNRPAINDVVLEGYYDGEHYGLVNGASEYTKEEIASLCKEAWSDNAGESE